MLDIIVVIPIYNEEGSVAACLNGWQASLDSLKVQYKILAINDGSTDSTAEKLKAFDDNPNIAIIHQENAGHGPAVMTGYAAACTQAHWVAQADSDNEIDPVLFATLWDAREGFDAVIGKRENRTQIVARKLLTRGVSFVIGIFFGRKVRDINAPFRLVKAETMQAILPFISEKCPIPNVLMSALLNETQYQVQNLPVDYQPRQFGTDSLKGLKFIEIVTNSLLTLYFFLIRYYFSKRKDPVSVFISTFFTRTFIIYCLIGLMGVTLDYVSFFVLLQITPLPYLVCNAISVTAGITNNFIFNSFFNFKTTTRMATRFLKFFTVGLIGLGLSSVLLYLCVDLLHLAMPLSKLLVLFFVVVVQFSLNRKFTFS